MIHELRNSGGVISMQHRDELLIPAGQSVQFKPGGLHLMLMNLNKMLREGETFELSLRFERAGLISIRVPVLGLRARAPD